VPMLVPVATWEPIGEDVDRTRVRARKGKTMTRADRSRARMTLKALLLQKAQLEADVATLKALAMHTPEGRAAFVQAQSVSEQKT